MFHASHEERIKQGPLGAVAPILGAIGGVASVAGLFMNKGGAPPAPVLEKPKVMPTPDDELVKRQRRRSIAEQVSRSGRSSTILSDQSDVLGA